MRFLYRRVAPFGLALLGALWGAGELTPSPAAAQRPSPHISTARCAANRAAGTITFLSPFGYDASAGILDVFAATKLGYFSELCLKVNFNPDLSFAPVYPEVSSGAATITGEGSAADDLVAVGDGAGFTAISTFGDTSDYALLTRRDISNLRQLAGKTLGYHTVLPVVLTEMLQKAGVDLAKVHEVNDTSYDPSLLVKGPYQALQAYQSNEPLTLDQEGDAKDFTEWTPAQFGIKGTFNVQVVNSRFLAAHESAVADFLRAQLHAFDYCEEHVASCIALEAQAAGTSYNEAHETEEWRLEVQLATRHSLPGKGIGVQSIAEWTPELQAVLSHKLLTHAPVLSRVEDTSLVASLYDASKLIWP